jgi:glycosyltransferase involved in cell wall biosynthesis
MVTTRSELKLHNVVSPLHANGNGNGRRKLHILFHTSTLGGGGAEKHLQRVMNHLDRETFRVSLAVVKGSGEFEQTLAGDVTKHHLTQNGAGSSSTIGMLKSIRPLRRVIETEQPDLLFSVIELANFASVFAAHKTSPAPKVVIGVQTPPSIAYHHTIHPISRLIFRLIPRVYAHADRLVALSKGVADDLTLVASATRGRVEVIHNAGVDADLRDQSNEAICADDLPGRPLLVACGRLKALKGFDYLLDALVMVRKVVPANLCIIGEGGERSALEARIKRLGLQSCVRLLGFQENPFKYMAAADVFVHSSLYEGFGNVIVEAMACGAPVVATDCPHGPREIIEDGRNGILAPPANAAALAKAILRVLTDRHLREQLAAAGKLRANDFEAQRIADAYGQLFLDVLNDPKPVKQIKKAVAG